MTYNFTYTRKTHDPAQIRYKVTHVANRLVEITIALRVMSEEVKELSDFLQAYSMNRSGQVWASNKAAKANVTATPAAPPAPPKTMVVVKSAAPASEPDEPPATNLSRLKKEVVQWLMSAPTDPCEEIAPLIPAPVSMVKRIRTQLVDAGKLRPLEEKRGENT